MSTLTWVTVPAYEPPKEPSSAMRESVMVGSPVVLTGSSALKVKSEDWRLSRTPLPAKHIHGA